MPKPPKPSRKHHFVPQAQLRHFAHDPERRSIWVFDKKTGRAWVSSLLNAGSEGDFNTVELDTGRWNFEYLFEDVDGRSAGLISAILERRSLAWLTAEDRGALIDLFATQMLRTRFSRTTPRHLAGRMREIVRELGYDPDGDPDYAMPSDRALRLGAVRSFLGRGRIFGSMARLVPVLFMAGEGKRFILSDDPVAAANAFAYGDHGLQSHGVIVMLPIAPDLAVALLCPTILDRYEAADLEEMDEERRARIGRYRDGFRAGSPVEIQPSEVDNWNRRQVSRAARYLYGATDDFEFAREMLADHPDLREVETHLHFGGLGGGPPKRSGIPSGLQLVIQGKFDHCIIPIAKLDEAGEGLTARTSAVELLELVARDENELRAHLYEDGQQRREIGQAMVERIGVAADGWFRVVHRDDGLRALMRQIDGR